MKGDRDESVPHAVVQWLAFPLRTIDWRVIERHSGFSGARLWRGTLSTPSISGESSESIEYCLRAWPLSGPDPQRLTWIHQRLQQAAYLRIVSVPLAGADSATFLMHDGRLWEVSPWLPGSPCVASVASLSQIQAAMRAVRQLHEAWGVERTSPRVPPAWLDRRHLLDRWIDPTEPMTRAIALALPHDELSSELRARGVAMLERWLPVAHEQIERWDGSLWPLQPVLRDLWSEHVLFTGAEVSGIIDYGAMRFDTIATDLGRLVGSWVGDDVSGWKIAEQAYGIAEPEESEGVWSFARSLEFCGLVLGVGNWLRWIWVERREFADWKAVAKRLATQLQRLERRD